MKVKDIMHKKVDYVTPKTPLKKVGKIIFGHKHTGLPVVEAKSKVLVGFLTDQDILAKCFPSIREYMEDVVHEQDFKAMEKKLKEIMSLNVENVMHNKPFSIHEDEFVFKAISQMKVKDIARLPVVDDKNRLVGIITKREIFRALVGKYV
jgi:CBS domain-containing protein